MITTVDVPVETLRQRIQKLLERKMKQKTDFKTDEKVRDFYTACLYYRSSLNKTRLEKDWTRYMSENLSLYIHQIMRKIGLGEWPYTANSLGNKPFRWFDVIPKLIEVGHMYTDGVLELPIINVEVGVDDFTRERYTLKLDAPDFDVDHDNTGINLCTKQMHVTGCNIRNDKSILTELETIMRILNPSQGLVNEGMLKRSLKIDYSIYKASRLPIIAKYGRSSKFFKDKKYRDYAFKNVAEALQYNTTTLSSLSKLTCGTTDKACTAPTWSEYIQSLFNASGNSHMKIQEEQKVIVKDPLYLMRLDETLEGLNIQPFEMANYLGWKVVTDFFIFLRNVRYEFQGDCTNYLMQGRSSNIRSEHGLLNGAVGSMYVREYFNPKWKKQVEEMVSYTKKVAKQFLQTSFHPNSKAIKKLEAMKEFIAYPEEMLSRSAIDEYYRDLSISN